MKKLLLILIIYFGLADASLYKNYFYNLSGAIDTILIVDKKQQKLYVFAENHDHQINEIDEFRVTTGRISGDKEKEGDLKTPEGIYTIIRKLNGNRLPDKYGPLAFVLNYPNYVDRLNNRNGSNIWIHGRNEQIKDRQTEGCISLENSHILDLAKYVTINQTQIVVLDSLDKDSLAVMKYRDKLRQFVDNWAISWSNGDLESYFSKYSQKFRENGRSFQAFKNRKQQLEKIYKWKQVKLDSISFIISKKEAHAHFQQTYISPRFTSVGEKTLTIVNEDAGLKIVKEDFHRTGQRINTIDEITEFLDNWEKAWETVDADQYIRFYDENFESEGRNRDWWYQDKKDKFTNINTINVKISNVNNYSMKEDQWIVRFHQRYTADNYKDYGIKTMVIEKQDDGGFKIINELWRALR